MAQSRTRSKTYGRIDPPRRVEILVGSGAGYFKRGQYAYAIGFDARGGNYWVDRGGSSSPGDIAYLISKTKDMRGGALWFSKDAIRFTGSTSGRRAPDRGRRGRP